MVTKEESKIRRIGSHEQEFKLAKVMSSSVFSPTVICSLPNLKRELPNLFK
jgi:hypothetical protein